MVLDRYLGLIVSRPFSYLYLVVILWDSVPACRRIRLFRLLAFPFHHRSNLVVNYNGVLGKHNIRSDYGHGTKDPYVEIELLDQTGKKKALNKNEDVRTKNYRNIIMRRKHQPGEYPTIRIFKKRLHRI